MFLFGMEALEWEPGREFFMAALTNCQDKKSNDGSVLKWVFFDSLVFF